LLQTPAGRAELESIYKAQEAAAKTSKLSAEATSEQAKARVAAPTLNAELTKKLADATKAVIESQFAERLQVAGLNKSNWDVLNLQSQIRDRSAKLNLDTQMTNATVLEKMSNIQKNLNEIPADTRKLINESAVTAATAQQSAAQFNDLANRIEGLGGYGKLSSLSEFAKSTIGAEGYETSLRQEYTRLRNSAAIKSLPPGPATDKDIQMA
jgi:ATP-dependent Lon protease